MRIALPNKGSLSEQATTMLREAGYKTRRDSRDLYVYDEANDLEIFFLRPRDIAIYVGIGKVDAGITGRDLLLDSDTAARELLPLGFGRSTFRFAARPSDIASITQLTGKRIATSYPVLVAKYLQKRAISAQVVRLDGAVETSVRLGVGDAIADVVETGSTLRAAGLETFGEPILVSEAVLVCSDGEASKELEVLTRRLASVLVARQYVLMDYNIPIAGLKQATQITPGIESPTVSALHDENWVAVRVMVAGVGAHQVMDDLYAIGARGILLSQIHACRL